MKKNRIKVILSLVMTFLLVVTMSNRVRANVIDLSRSASLEVHYFGDQSEISIYKIADVDINAKMSICDEFASYPLDFSDENNWEGVALALQGYIIADKLEATSVQTTNADGITKFDGLQPGVYYVCGSQVKQDGYLYTPMPALVSVPRVVDGEATYDVVINMKHEKEKYVENINLDATKVWKDDGHEDKRPSKIEVGLYKDGELYDQKELNEKNSWHCRWEDLDGEAKWSITEIYKDKTYKVTLNKEEHSFVLTNTYFDDDSNDDTPDKNIPQTGQLWMPVMLLCALGLGFVCVGLVLKRKGN